MTLETSRSKSGAARSVRRSHHRRRRAGQAGALSPMVPGVVPSRGVLEMADGASGAMTVLAQAARSIVLRGRRLAEALPAVDLAHGDLARGEQRPEQHGRGLGRGQHGLRLDAALELLVQPLDRVRRPRRLPLARGQAGEGEQPLAGLLQAVGDRAALQPPLAQERACGAPRSPSASRRRSCPCSRPRPPRAAPPARGPADSCACGPCTAAPAHRARGRRAPSPARRRRR